MGDKIKNLGVRTLSGAVFAVVLIACIMWNVYSFTTLFFIVAIWGLVEFYGLMEKTGTKPNKVMGIISGLLIFGWNLIPLREGLFNPLMHLEFFVLVIPLIFSVFITELFRKTDTPFQNIGITLLGLLYVVLPFKLFTTIPVRNHVVHLSDEAYAWQIPLGIILLIWCNDTFAYLSGSVLGKNKLFERISPGKTREGTIGGALLTIACSCFFNRCFESELSQSDWVIIALMVAIIGTLGDLCESMLKRSLGVKDSGTIMPGHGGILDRFDSLILSSPFVFTYLFLVH